MSRLVSRIWKPVQRKGADRYLRLNILSFAASVTLTRLLLELTGYPQMGNESLHIAHVLYGGILLYASSLLPLLYANRWAYTWSAITSGVGVGLFIDEVGKFITQANDYFFPAAAPIIYACFLLTVLLYLRVSRKAPLDARAEFYAVLETLSEVLDHDLDREEYQELCDRLSRIKEETSYPNMVRLAVELTDFVETDALEMAAENPNLFDRIIGWIKIVEGRYITSRRVKAFLLAGLFLLGLPSMSRFLTFMEASSSPQEMDAFLSRIASELPSSFHFSGRWAVGYVIADSVMGATLVAAAALLMLRRERWATEVGSVGLLGYLLGLNLILFYLEQFSTIITAGMQYLVLQTMYYYQRKI